MQQEIQAKVNVSFYNAVIRESSHDLDSEIRIALESDVFKANIVDSAMNNVHLNLTMSVDANLSVLEINHEIATYISKKMPWGVMSVEVFELIEEADIYELEGDILKPDNYKISVSDQLLSVLNKEVNENEDCHADDCFTDQQLKIIKDKLDGIVT